MSSKQGSRRLVKAKSEIAHCSRTMDNLRSISKNDFFNRSKISRNKSVDNLRNIVEDDNESVDNPSDNLKDQKAANLKKTDEVNDALNQIENKLAKVILHTEAEEHQMDTGETVNQRMLCVVCNNNVGEKNDICKECTAEMNSTLFD